MSTCAEPSESSTGSTLSSGYLSEKSPANDNLATVGAMMKSMIAEATNGKSRKEWTFKLRALGVNVDISYKSTG